MDYSEKVRLVAISALKKMEEGQNFSNAFSMAFRNSDFNPEMYHMVRIGVKSFHRSWKNEKARALAGSRGMSNQAHENISPLSN
jgi:hypothetical protein